MTPDLAAALAAPPSGSLARRVGALAVLLVSEFLYGWAWNSVDVLRPFFRASLHLSLLQAGSAYSAQDAGALVGALIIAQFADRLGRHRILPLVIAGYGLALLAGVFVTSYPQILADRAVLGFFMGGSFPVAVGIYVGLFAARTRGRLAGLMNVSFSGSIMALGFALRFTAAHDWRMLLWLGALPALALAPIAAFAIPPDPRRTRPTRLPVGELFAPAFRRQTLLLALMTGLNFVGYQAYSGWLTTYLTGVRGLSAAAAGSLVAWQFAGNILGGFVWGFAADRLGRRFNALGFVIAAFCIAAFLAAPDSLPLLRATGFLYGATLCASVVWGPWLAELYPPHLRSTAASIFNWGRALGFFAPLATAAIAARFGLASAMLTASLCFLGAAAIWVTQPETVRPA